MVPEKNVMEYVPFGQEDKIKLTVGIVTDMVCVPTKSGAKCSDKEAIKFMMLCRSRGLNPFEGDAFLLGYDSKDGPSFSLITAHQAFLKRAELHPEYDGMQSGVFVRLADGTILDREGDFFDEGETLLGGWAVVHFKTRKHPMKKRLKLGTFHKGYGRWQVDPAGMIVKCVEADALRSAFPTKLGGLYLRDEMPDGPTLSNTIDVPAIEAPKASAKSKLEKPPPEPGTAPEIQKPITKVQTKRITDLLAQLDLPPSEVESIMGGDVAALTESQADEVLAKLRHLEGAQSKE